MKRVFASTVAFLLVVGASSLFLRASSVAVPSGTWAATGDLNDIRAGAAAVLLFDGVVLITGGSGADGRVASAERYSVPGGTFIATESMQTARANHTATVLNDGRVLVVGGTGADGTAVGNAEIYDPATNVWASVGPLAHARAGHTATLLPDGRVLVAGGESGEGALATLEMYSPVFEQFSLIGAPMTAARMRHAAALAGEKVLITGGWDGAASLASVDVFDPANDSISAGPAMLSARAEHTATTLLNGNVLVAGGLAADGDLRTAEVFDADAGGFVPANTMAAARRNHMAILLPHNNSVLIAGGWSGGAASKTAELYRAWQDGGIFVSTGSSLAPRNWSAGNALSFGASATNRGGPADGLVLVAGGDGASSAELYGFATVKTDKDDYQPGDVVYVSGSGWLPNQPVTFYVRELPAEHFARLVTIEADAAGNISSAKLFDVEQHHLGVRFLLTAADGVSQAHMTFTDGNVDTTGTVTSSASGNPPIQNATVTCTAGCNEAASATTNATGNYSRKFNFSGNDPTSITLTASATGFVSKSVTVTVTNGQNPAPVVNFVLDPAVTNRTLTITGSGAGRGTVASDVGSINCSIASGVATGTCSASVADGTIVTLTANPNATLPLPAGSTFDAWSGDGTGTTTRSVTMNVNKSVNAHFKANQTITVTTNAPASAVYNTTFNVAATASSGLNVGIMVSGVCAIDSGGTNNALVKMTSGSGTCTVHYNEAGNANYNAASEVTESVTAQKANQTITVTTAAAASAVYSTTFNVAATASSGLEVTITVSGVCAIDSGGTNNAVVKMTSGTGVCTVHYNQAGNVSFNAAPEVTSTTNATKATATVSVTGYTGNYDGAAHGATGSVTGVDAGGAALGTTLDVGATFINVPGGTASWTFTGGNNYADQSGTAQIVINKAAATVTVSGYTGTYDGAAHGATGAVTGVDAGGAALGTTLNLGATFTNVPGGTADWTFTGGTNYIDQSGTAAIVINKATATVTVTGYTGTYDAAAHGATASVTGADAGGAALGTTLDLGGTFINAPGGTAAWTFSGGTNYTNQNGSVAVVINKAVATVSVTGYSGTYDGASHGATGSVTGVDAGGAALGTTLNLGVSFVDFPGGTANWNFTGGTNYTNQSGSVAIVINKATPTVAVSFGTSPVTFDGNPHPATVTVTGVSGPLAIPTNGTTAITYTRNAASFVGTPTLVGVYTAAASFTSANSNYTNAASTTNASLTILTACSSFNGFLSPVGGAVEKATGGSFADPVRAFKLNSTVPVKFSATCFETPLTTGIHTLEAIKYSNATSGDAAIDATPTDAATTGSQFRLTGTEWHFNLSTKALGGNAQGIWLLKATLFDGSSYSVWVEVKK